MSPLHFRKNSFQISLAAFNILFLFYLLLVGYYNRLALDDFAYYGIYKEYGFFNPFTYWYFNWQGRFAPQFFLNFMFMFFDLTGNLFFYPVVVGGLFILSLYRLLRIFFNVSTPVLLNYSIFIFSAIIFTTFELSTFYWICASVDYFVGTGFALLGASYIFDPYSKKRHFVAIAFCAVYTGSSSENVGAFLCFVLVVAVIWQFVGKASNAGNFNAHLKLFFADSLTKKLLVALFFALGASIIMVSAPGTDVRLGQTQHVTEVIELIVKTFKATVYVFVYVFYKLPYFIAYIPVFIFIGALVDRQKNVYPFRYVFIVGAYAATIFVLVFISNLPMVYAIGHWGPLRAYVYVTVIIVASLFGMSVYTGMRYRQEVLKYGIAIPLTGISLLLIFSCYTIASEWPLLRAYNISDRHRRDVIKQHVTKNTKEPLYLEPLVDPQYNTITDLWRKVTATDRLPTHMTDLPVLVGDISEQPDWRNNHLKAGLGLKFNVFLKSKSKNNE
jgi:hypothetical protein